MAGQFGPVMWRAVAVLFVAVIKGTKGESNYGASSTTLLPNF